MNTRIDTKCTELNHLKEALSRLKKLNYADVPTTLMVERVESKIQKLTTEIAELKKS